MAPTFSSSMMVPGTPSIPQLDQRDVADVLRYIAIGNASITSLIANQLYNNKTGEVTKGKGLISKRVVKNVRYEMFNRSARPYKYSVVSGTEVASTGITMASVNGLYKTQMIYNPRNKTGFRIEDITGVVLKGATVGTTTFSCEADDELIAGPSAIKAGSAVANILNGTDDNTYNTLQYSRLGVSISWVFEKIKMLAGGERLPREKIYLAIEYLADQERALFLGDMTADFATKNTTTGIQTGYTTEEFPTTKGFIKLAANSYDMSGAVTLDKLMTNLPQNMGDTVNDNADYIAFCGNEVFGKVQASLREKHFNTEGEGELKQFGIKSSKLITDGPNLHFVKHSIFNSKGLKGSMLIMDPGSVGYVYLEGYDLAPNNGIQTPATHGKEDELVSYFGAETKDGGKGLTYVTNCL